MTARRDAPKRCLSLVPLRSTRLKHRFDLNPAFYELYLSKKLDRFTGFGDFEYRLLVGCVNKARTAYIDEGKPTSDISALLIKIIDTPRKKTKVRS